ncbi:MAG TPA: hypothetical protein VKS82_26975 [Streptosporangiaceae bacterium]|nr:hypothetical protein [Streptosporangiaceae bacterium]
MGGDDWHEVQATMGCGDPGRRSGGGDRGRAWVAETPAASQQTGSSPPGLILLHWDGSRWQGRHQ